MLSGQGAVRRIGVPLDTPLRAYRIDNPSISTVATVPMSGKAPFSACVIIPLLHVWTQLSAHCVSFRLRNGPNVEYHQQVPSICHLLAVLAYEGVPDRH